MNTYVILRWTVECNYVIIYKLCKQRVTETGQYQQVTNLCTVFRISWRIVNHKGLWVRVFIQIFVKIKWMNLEDVSLFIKFQNWCRILTRSSYEEKIKKRYWPFCQVYNQILLRLLIVVIKLTIIPLYICTKNLKKTGEKHQDCQALIDI